MLDFLSAFIIAISFLTFIPMPKIEWTQKRMRFVPFLMPVVGLVCSCIGFILYTLLLPLNFNIFIKGVIMCLYYVVFTGGLHIDGLMDSADAYFSRQDKVKKLEIMKDTNIGAFAVITLIFVLLLKTSLFSELFSREIKGGLLIFIPIISRILQPSMIYLFPSAKPEGLTKMFGDTRKGYSIIFLVYLLMICALLYFFFGLYSLILVVVALIYYIFFYFSSKKQFGGITGDLCGAFLEISELIMLAAVLFYEVCI